MQFLKELIRNLLIITMIPFWGILRAFDCKLIYIDETRIGHYFGDTIALLTFFKKTRLIFPVMQPCSSFITSQINLSANITVVRSRALKKVTGWLRNYPIFVLNLSNSLNPVHDVHFFKNKIFLPRYKFNDLNLNELINDNKLRYMIGNFKENLGIKEGKIISFNHRSLEHDRDSGEKHTFRNFDSRNAQCLLKELEKSTLQVINLSLLQSNAPNVINLKQADYTIDHIIFSILVSDFYVGDSTGTTVVAQIHKINSFLYNIFPRNFNCTNTKSLICPVSYHSVDESFPINPEQVDLFQTKAHFDLNKVILKPPNENEVLSSFHSWLKVAML
jgi:hypothetical protein